MKLFLTIALALFLALPGFAEASGNIGASYSKLADDTAFGLDADFNYEEENYQLSLDATAQFGEIYKNKIHGEILFPFWVSGLKVSADGTVKGYEIDGLGLDNNINLALSFPIESLNINVDVGVGGQSASPWADPDPLYRIDPDTGEYVSADEDPSLLPFQDGNFLNVFGATGFSKYDVDVDVKGVWQVYGKGDKSKQLHLRFETGRELLFGINANVVYEHSVMLYQNETFQESAVITTFGLKY